MASEVDPKVYYAAEGVKLFIIDAVSRTGRVPTGKALTSYFSHLTKPTVTITPHTLSHDVSRFVEKCLKTMTQSESYQLRREGFSLRSTNVERAIELCTDEPGCE